MAQKTSQKESIATINLKKVKDVVLPKHETPLIISKEVTVDEKSIKLPSDFDSLHNIKDFGKTYKQVISFIDNIKTYQYEYLDNMLKTTDEVLQFIPENQLDKYNVYLQDIKLCPWNKLKLEHINHNIADRRHYDIRRMYSVLNGTDNQLIINQRDKIFLIDPVNKKIQLCLWYRHNYRETIQGWLYDNFCNLEYCRDYSFNILPDEDIFRVVVKLGHKAILTPEQVNEYRNRSWMHDNSLYSIGSQGGYEIYDFCMRTNTFKEYNEKESYSNWHYHSNRTFKY